jgi:D-glycero-beta-D-manno-heptose-7-phosphate kinase
MTRADLKKFAGCRILVIGDVMLDHFIWGSVRRISPEAPVPVVEVTNETWYPGGAANVARNVAPFTRHISIMGRIGSDSQADTLRALLKQEGVNCAPLLVSRTVPTISKARVIARQQQVVRVDRESLRKLDAAELRQVEKKLRAMAGKLDAVIIEDYGKGFVTAALVASVTRIAQEAGFLVTVDPSPGNPLSWRGVDLVKPNRLEAFASAGIADSHSSAPPLQNAELLRVGEVLLEKWAVPRVLVTLGEQGMMLFQSGRKPHHIPTRAREVFDVSGAGDTAIALLTLALASGMKTEAAADVANHASGIVVAKLGTATLTPDELLAAVNEP